MDCQMPDMNGFECTREIRRLYADKQRAQPTIVAVTGYIADNTVIQAKQAGMNQVFSKPVRPELLAELCRQLNIC